METLPSGTPAHLARSEWASRGLIVIPDVWGLRPLFTEMCDALAARTGWSAALLQAQLLELELEGLVASLPGGLFQRMAQS